MNAYTVFDAHDANEAIGNTLSLVGNVTRNATETVQDGLSATLSDTLDKTSEQMDAATAHIIDTLESTADHGRKDLEAIVSSTSAVAQAIGDATKTWFDIVTATLRANMSALGAVTSARTSQEATDAWINHTGASMDMLIENAKAFPETGLETVEAALSPIIERADDSFDELAVASVAEHIRF